MDRCKVVAWRVQPDAKVVYAIGSRRFRFVRRGTFVVEQEMGQ